MAVITPRQSAATVLWSGQVARRGLAIYISLLRASATRSLSSHLRSKLPVLEIIYGENSSTPAARALQDILKQTVESGTLYFGYPTLASADEKIFVDALLISATHGIVVFDLTSQVSPRPTPSELSSVVDRQNQIHAFIFNKLNAQRELRRGRSLGFDVHIVSCHPSVDRVIKDEDMVLAPPSLLPEVLADLPDLDDSFLRPLNAAIQRVSTLRPAKRRDSVRRNDSRGATLKRIEKEIANLDQWQNRGAIEYTDGPQRIRGLAGSGKTVVLALKAAHMHARHPDWTIAVTFQSRALYQQFKDLIRRFTFDQIEDEPNWNNLQVMHAWGSSGTPGIYSSVCAAYGVPYQSWGEANQKFGSRAFEGACKAVNKTIQQEGPKPLFDVVLIDEAQDFPPAFYRMMYQTTSAPHRIIWAYDDLQNLGDYEMRSEQELFGSDDNGNPRVALRNEPDRPRQDIVLPVCYRNTPWVLASAHALGFGIYRKPELVQIFEEPSIWTRIGYEVVRGSLELDQDVSVRRSSSSYPPYFVELLDPDDVIKHATFASPADQYRALADDIHRNIHEDELDPTDILIVLPSAYTSKRIGGAIMSALAERDIVSHLAGC